MPDEPAGAGGGMGPPAPPARWVPDVRTQHIGPQANFDMKIPAVESAQRSLAGLNDRLGQPEGGAAGVSCGSYMLSAGYHQLLAGIETQAKATAGALSGVNIQPWAGSVPVAVVVRRSTVMTPSYGAYALPKASATSPRPASAPTP